jgi:hypothetical protein
MRFCIYVMKAQIRLEHATNLTSTIIWRDVLIDD